MNPTIHHDGPPRAGADDEAPYADALLRHASRGPVSFMVPGHGATGDGFAAGQAEFAGERALAVDVTQLLDGIDLGRDSPRERAHRMAAEAWGARRTWFLTNGSSQGNRLAALAVSQLGDGIVIQRSAHSSVVDGVILAGLRPAYALPGVDIRNGIAHGVTPASVAKAIADHPGPVTAVYIVSPSYFGAVADVPAIARLAHDAGAALIVDCAWGAHFGFHPDLPLSPVRQGADIVVMSTHKMTSSLHQSAVLHLGDTDLADTLEPALERAYRMTASTSESSLLIGSIDVARRDLQRGGPQVDDALRALAAARERVRAEQGISLIEDTFFSHPDIVDHDPLRMPIDVSGICADAHALRLTLARDFGIWVEMATRTTLVPLVGIGKRTSFDRLVDAVLQTREDAAPHEIGDPADLPSPGAARVSPRDAFYAPSEVVPHTEAVGRTSADALSAYPPGIPNILPGEEITRPAVDFLMQVARSPGGYVRGAVLPDVSRFRVIGKP
ncbi:ornithine decarboxylase [Embleya hyalina]|uniref:Ornithine decarboxylase n=1 Tax=Embleya hyalina TaxID=516124 RepID=A0A401YVG1_9ACTN|nr:aminotransferase class V-fold PLP-dependent enzyme [Embleya hyalina]GCD98604.1 ornithine decarboxylase [Embleya hyalina]